LFDESLRSRVADERFGGECHRTVRATKNSQKKDGVLGEFIPLAFARLLQPDCRPYRGFFIPKRHRSLA
jgi:hypothetical protein